MATLLQQNLLIDADDTLWENNIYFEKVIEAVQEILLPFGTAPHLFRKQLDELERQHVSIFGYGTLNFTRSLVTAFASCLPPNADKGLCAQVEALALGIMRQPLEIIEGVPETLAYLASRHSLYLVTKGDPEEQSRKIDSSRLATYFQGTEILAEKDSDSYRSLVERHSWNPIQTWMIGNSPKSDVNPAISAGLNAVFIPHPHTWMLEHEEPMAHPRVIKLEKFADLRLHF